MVTTTMARPVAMAKMRCGRDAHQAWRDRRIVRGGAEGAPERGAIEQLVERRR